MGPESSSPAEYGLIIRYVKMEDFVPVICLCAFSLLLTIGWLIGLICYLRTRSRSPEKGKTGAVACAKDSQL